MNQDRLRRIKEILEKNLKQIDDRIFQRQNLINDYVKKLRQEGIDSDKQRFYQEQIDTVFKQLEKDWIAWEKNWQDFRGLSDDLSDLSDEQASGQQNGAPLLLEPPLFVGEIQEQPQRLGGRRVSGDRIRFPSASPVSQAAAPTLVIVKPRLEEDLPLSSLPAETGFSPALSENQSSPLRFPSPAELTRPLRIGPYTYREHATSVYAVAWSLDGRRIASGGDDGKVNVWDTITRDTLFSTSGHSSSVFTLAWSPVPGDNRLASAGVNLMIWDGTSGKKINSYSPGPHAVTSLAWSPDGERLAFASFKTARVWTLDAKQDHILPYHGHQVGVSALAWSPDGECIVSGGGDYNRIQVWEASRSNTMLTYHHSAGSRDANLVTCVAWSPYKMWIASAGGSYASGKVEIWEAATGKTLLTYEKHSDLVTSIAWSSDWRYIASASRDKTIQVWNALTGETLFTYYGHAAQVNALAWSPDGKYIASASMDHTVQIWQAVQEAPPRPVSEPCDPGTSPAMPGVEPPTHPPSESSKRETPLSIRTDEPQRRIPRMSPAPSEYDLIQVDQLDRSIRETLDLLEKYRRAWLLEDDPRRKESKRLQIAELKEVVAQLQQELEALKAKISLRQSPQLADSGAQLQQLNAKIDAVLEGQMALQATILARLDTTGRAIISTFLVKLDQSQLVTIQAILDGISARQIPEPELQETLSAVQDTLAELRQRGAAIPHLSSEENEHLSNIFEDSTLGTSQKLSLTIPIIPFILSYQAEIGLQSGLNLKAIWKRLVDKTQGSSG